MARAAVIFDLDDTLIVEQDFAMASLREALGEVPGVDPVASEPVALEAIRGVWRQGPEYAVCLELGIASWEGLWATFEGNHESLAELASWAPTYRHRAWEAAVNTLGVDDPTVAAVAAERFRAAQRRGHPDIDGARVTLERIAGSHPVGLLTNGSSDLQRLKLEQAGLEHAFDDVVVSGEVGRGKPDPAVFVDLLDRLGARPEHSVMVGDSWERDVEGALGVGMSVVWIAAGRSAPRGHPRVTVVETVNDLPGLLN
ncbi:MAG: HAD family hydrolase [Acidimicrobiales bacterium]|jgi:putative hydrolase of the HAD superfamily